MGREAVDLLLAGKSDLVVCSREDRICTTEINYALILDRMYKNKLKDGDLDSFTPEQISEMRKFCENKAAEFKKLYDTSYIISR